MKSYKYQDLQNFFSKSNESYLKLTFQEIESIIGFKLPESAYKYEAYWYPSETHTICKSWTENGWKVISVKIGEYIEFQNTELNFDSKIVQYKIEVYLSEDLIDDMITEATKLGACKIGDYDHIASYYEIKGCWRPLENSQPFTGEKNIVNYGSEYKLELRCEEKNVKSVLKRIREIHPYEEALVNVIRLENHLFE